MRSCTDTPQTKLWLMIPLGDVHPQRIKHVERSQKNLIAMTTGHFQDCNTFEDNNFSKAVRWRAERARSVQVVDLVPREGSVSLRFTNA